MTHRSMVRQLFLAIAILLCNPSLRATEQQISTVVLVEQERSHSTYKIDAHPVKDLLFGLSEVAEKKGKDQPIVVLINSSLPCQELWTVAGVAMKAELSNVRFFVVFRDSEMMVEIKRMPAVAFTTTPK